MAGDAPAFISYSRRDYYFAESLAFHLAARGVPAWLDVKDLQPGADWNACLETALDAAPVVILVASPDSVASANVRAEWTRALAAGKRVIVARFRSRRLPAELARVELIDFRGVFGRAVDRLVATLRSSSPAGPVARAWLPFPPWVCVVAALLGVLSSFPLVLADYGEMSDAAAATGARIQSLAGAVVVIGAFVWFTWLAFVRRRMSSRDLALTFAFFAGVTAYPLAQHLFAGLVPEAYGETTMRVVRAAPLVPALMCGLAVGGLAIVALVRPEDLLRWTPTGGAWGRLRLAQAARLEGKVSAISARFGSIREFQVLHDPVDRPAGDRLRGELLRGGARETPEGTAVLILTNRTHTSWIQQESARYADRLFTVVGTGIGLPSTLDWLWKRQWLDFRSWSVDEVERHSGLPDVPESLAGLRLPGAVSRIHHVMCALAALSFAAGGAVMPVEGDLDLGTPTGLVVMLAEGLTIAWACMGRRLIRRTMTYDSLVRWFWPLTAATVVSSGVALMLFVAADGITWRIIPGVLFLMAAPVWLWTRRATMHFWCPEQGSLKGETLTAPRNWRTIVRVSLYTMLWYIVLNPAGMR